MYIRIINGNVNIINPLFNQVLETDTEVSEEIVDYIIKSIQVACKQKLPNKIDSLQDFKNVTENTYVAPKIPEYKNLTNECIQQLQFENSELLKQLVMKDGQIKQLQQDISDLAMLITRGGK